MPTPLRQTSGEPAPAHLASRQVLFAVIAAFSAVRTPVFLAFEVGFLVAWDTNLARYVGAVTSLAIGNFLKHRLDRAFTFGQGAFDRTAGDWKAGSWS
jgi:hypothetical protein